VQSPGHGAARWLRAAALVALTALVSIGGHALAGGPVHVSGPMVLGVLALGAMCVAAADVRRTFPEILAVVLLAQPPLHLLASLGGHDHSAPVSLTAESAGITPSMLIAHGAAALLVSVLLADVERLWWALDGLRWRTRLPEYVAAVPVATPTIVPVAAEDVPTASALRAAPRYRRGPPVVVAAA
jgi:hypothetical protein